MSELTLQESKSIQHLWKNREWEVGDKVWYEDKKHIVICNENPTYPMCYVVMGCTKKEIKCVRKDELTLQADTCLMLEALPKSMEQDIFYYEPVLEWFAGKQLWVVAYKHFENVLKYFKNKDIDKALQQMHVYLKDNGLMEAK